MKKKIKDITFFDVNEACLKNSKCNTCPFYIQTPFTNRYNCIMDQMSVLNYEEWPEIINQEVEI